MFVPNRSQVLELIAAAISAPSADNQHHVRFSLKADGLDLRADEVSRSWTPHRRLLALLSYGALAENVRLRLTTHGYSFDPKWFPDPSDPALLLSVRWADLHASPGDPLAARIESRHTNRRLRFAGPPMTAAEREAFDESIRPVDGVALWWADDKTARRALLGQIRVAERERFSTRFLHAELFDSIAFEAGWQAETEERLAPGSLAIEPALRLPFALLRHWPVMRFVRLFAGAWMLGLRAGDLPARMAPHLGVLVSRLDATDGALATGAAFQRVWLTADQSGFALQPMVASAILAAAASGPEGMRDATRRQLQSGWTSLVGDAVPLVVFRLGRAEQPALRSRRRPAESYLA